MKPSDVPLMTSLSEWAWDNNDDPLVTPTLCLDSFPFLNGPCFSSLFAKVLGIGIILGACLVKLPILLNILKNKSVAGLSAGATYGEVIMYWNSAFYGILRGNPFTAYGENFAVAIQSLVITVMLWQFQKDPAFTMQQKATATTIFAGYVIFVLNALPEEYYYTLVAANWPALMYSRGSQIIDFARLRHTGTNSVITMSMNLLGSLIRVFTTIKEVGWDLPLLSGYLLSIVLNVVLVSQYFLFKENTEEFLKSLKKKQE
eukprot:2596659-Ditylum_brightwellii.AAC.1